MLGRLEVRNTAGLVELGGVKQRTVMAVLLLHPNEPVAATRLAIAIWGEDAPRSAVRTVQVYVSRLRKVLGEEGVLVRTPLGYRLTVRSGELDVDRFERLVEDGRSALATGEAERASTVLREALALWRGPPLAEFEFEQFAQAEIARLQEARLTALDTRIEADLAAARHAMLVTELRQLVTSNPTRERFAAHLMLALYRCGRQADALESYHAARRELLECAGVEPGPDLRRLEAAILRHDVGLQWRPPAVALPLELDAEGAPALVGRDRELKWLRRRWEAAAGGRGLLVVVTGVEGIGRTRLVMELAGEIQRSDAAVVRYVADAQSDEALLVALGPARLHARPTLLVVGDMHAAGDALAAIALAVATLPVLVVVRGGESVAGAGDTLRLQPLDADAIGVIAAAYGEASGHDEELTIASLQQASAGIPARVHEVAAAWIARQAARRVDVAAGRTAAGRSELRSMEDELAGDIAALQTARERVTHDRDDADVVCPFKGLTFFDTSDAAYFFGREQLVAELVARLVGAPLLAIVGPSGSGKSSVLRAGLLPALASGVLPGSERWAQVVVRPGEHPLGELERVASVADADGARILAIDQFEETFTACRDETERAAFIGELARVARTGGSQRSVVLVVRADYYGRCAAYPELSSLLSPDHVLVGPMRRDELRRAIESPARRAGLRVEPELTDALLSDVEQELGGLPLLSATLLELWQRRDGTALRLDAYLHSGGVHGAVERLANGAFDMLAPAQQAMARSVLMRLVAEGNDDAIERRRVPLSELGIDHSEDVAQIVASLTDGRLLTVDTGTVEFAHEAVLHEWPRLRQWIEDDRESLRIQRSLTSAAVEWRRLDCDREALYRGTRLARAIEWREARDPPLNEAEREFLATSDGARRAERATSRRRTGLVLAGLATALVVAIVAAVIVGTQRDVARSRDLASKSAAVVATDPPLALTLAREALDRKDTEQAENAMRQATLADRATHIVATGQGLAYGIAPSPDGRFAATPGANGTVAIWNLGSGRRAAEIHGFDSEVRAVSYSHDGRFLAIATRDGHIAVAAPSGGIPRVVTRLAHRDFASSIDFGAGSRALAIGTDRGRVALLSLPDGKLRDLNRDLKPHPGPADVIYAVAFDADARRIVSAGGDGVARIWDVSGGAPVKLRHDRDRFGQPQLIAAVTFSPDGRRVATADDYGSVLQWGARSGREIARIAVSDKQQASVRYSDDGSRIVTGGIDGVIHVSELRDQATLAELRGHDGPVRAAFIPHGHGRIVSVGEEDATLRMWPASSARVPPQPGADPLFDPVVGRRVVSVDFDDQIHVWNPATGRDRTLASTDRGVAAGFSPDAKQVVSASFDGPVRLWDLATGQSRLVPTLPGAKFVTAMQPRTGRIAIGGNTRLVIQGSDGGDRIELRGHDARVNALAFSPDGRHLLSGSDDGTARIWNAGDGALEQTLHPHQGVIRGVSYGTDARHVATAGSDGTAAVWTVGGGDPVILAGHVGGVNTVRFDPRGDRLVTAGDDGTIRIWKPTGGDALVILDQYAGIATGADFSRDGRYVVSAGGDGMRLSPCEVCGTFADVRRLARKRTSHELTPLERQRLAPRG